MSSSIRRLPGRLLAALALVAAGCSSTSTPSTPSTPSTTPPPSTGSPNTPAATCTFTLSSTSLAVAPAGGSSTISVTSGTGCAWTASTSSSFITITSGASGSGNGSVAFSVAVDSGANRTGTVTIAGQTVTITQTGAGIIVAFDMFDIPSQPGPTAVCRIRGAPGYPITSCPLTTTSRTTGSNSIVNWAWTVKYTYDGAAKTQTQNTGSIQDFMVWEYCGREPSSAAGTVIPLSVSLTVTDNNGIQATATSGSGTQPALQLVTYTCGS